MLKKWKWQGPGVRVLPVAAGIRAVIFASLAAMVQPAASATSQTDHAPADKGKWIKPCKSDIQRYCDEANLKQECLVAHWSKISAECREVLGTSAGNRAGDGS